MRYFPVFLDLKRRLCVVVGGGKVAERKIRSLLKAGARVKVVSPQLTPSLSRLKEKGKVTHIPRSYRGRALDGAFLAIAATDDRTTNERVFRDGNKKGILINIVDDPSHCNFIVPSVVKKGDLLIAISTSGKSPALARILRRKLEKEIGSNYPFMLKFLSAVRKKLFSRRLGQRENQKIFRRLLQEDLFPLIKEKKGRELDRYTKSSLGTGFSLKELGIRF